jgi:hypothetical protein
VSADGGEDRERRILAVAREYVGIDGAEIGATPGERVWRSGDAGDVRRHFLKVVGRADLPDRRPPRAPVRIEWMMGSWRMQVSGEVRTRGELTMALRAFGKDPASFVLGEGGPLKVAVGGRALTDFAEVMPVQWPGRRRERDSLTVARTLTLYYLSRAGGGTHTLAGAASLWEAQGWRLPLSWQSAHSRALKWIREVLGDV